MTAAVLILVLAKAVTPGTQERLPPSNERCAIVTAALKAKFGTGRDRWYAPGIDQGCARKNGYRDGVVLVFATVEKKLRGRKMGKSFLAAGQSCGADILSMPPSRVPRKNAKDIIHVVFLDLVPDGSGGFRFYEHLQPIDVTDPLQRKGVVGTSCFPAWEGILTKDGKGWTGRLKEESPWVEPLPEDAEETLRELRASGIAPGAWPPDAGFACTPPAPPDTGPKKKPTPTTPQPQPDASPKR